MRDLPSQELAVSQSCKAWLSPSLSYLSSNIEPDWLQTKSNNKQTRPAVPVL